MTVPSFPTNWQTIEDDPDFRALPPDRQRQWRDAWIREMVTRRGQLSPKDAEKAYQTYEAIAYSTVPKEQWPSELRRPIRQRTPTEAFFSITPSDVLSHAWTGLGRGLGLPQQIVATYLTAPTTMIREGVTAPLRNLYSYLAEGKETELPGGEITRTLTDPLLWGGLATGGLSLLLRGKSIPQLISLASRHPHLKPTIDWYISQLTRKAPGYLISRQSTRGPIGLEEVGVVRMTPEHERIISTITKNPQFKRTFPSPKQLQDFAETYARASDEERKVLLEMTKDPIKLLDLKEWLAEHPARRTPLIQPPPSQPPTTPPTTPTTPKTPKTPPKTKRRRQPPAQSRSTTAPEDLNNPSAVSDYLTRYLSERGD